MRCVESIAELSTALEVVCSDGCSSLTGRRLALLHIVCMDAWMSSLRGVMLTCQLRCHCATVIAWINRHVSWSGCHLQPGWTRYAADGGWSTGHRTLT
jgi:hypothetical protein